MFVVGKDLVTEFVDELVKAQVDLSLHLVIQELFAEFREGKMGTVIVQVQRVEDVPATCKQEKRRILNCGGAQSLRETHSHLQIFPHDWRQSQHELDLKLLVTAILSGC